MLIKKMLTLVFAVLAFMLGLVQQAHAEVPAAVTTAITAAGADMVTTITAVIVAFVAFWGLRKLGQKFGWI
jgi:ABC-type methionine transport system permease subunit